MYIEVNNACWFYIRQLYNWCTYIFIPSCKIECLRSLSFNDLDSVRCLTASGEESDCILAFALILKFKKHRKYIRFAFKLAIIIIITSVNQWELNRSWILAHV